MNNNKTMPCGYKEKMGKVGSSTGHVVATETASVAGYIFIVTWVAFESTTQSQSSEYGRLLFDSFVIHSDFLDVNRLEQ